LLSIDTERGDPSASSPGFGEADLISPPGASLLERRESQREPYGLCNSSPPPIFLTLEPSQVSAGDRQRAVVEEPRHILDALARIPAELSCTVPKDVETSRGKTGLREIPAEPPIEGGAAESLPVRRGRRGPQRFMAGHVLKVAPVGREPGS